jgi:hypothetical protein
MVRLVHGISTLSCFAALLAVSERAEACGGCFHPETPAAETTVVTGHRMAFAVSDDRTVLWDQIKYSGPAEDFSWVLPVRPGAYLEPAFDAWFEALDAVTATRVSAPQLRCAVPDSPSGGCGANVQADSGLAVPSSGGFIDENGVNVLHQGTVGPYETVTLESTTSDALTGWLNEHGYDVPLDVRPIIAEYVSEGFDFLALRLSPGVGVDSMTPVRVVTPGPRGALPLRMVAAGVGESVAITLYVIGEARFALPDLSEVTLDERRLSWDFARQQSNYEAVRTAALDQHFGASYLTTFADVGAFSKVYSDANGVPFRYLVGAGGPLGATFPDLQSLYFGQALFDDGLDPNGCPGVAGALGRNDPVTGAPSEVAAFSCGAYDDIAAAMIGMHPASVWLNRLDLDLPRAALSADCIVEPNQAQETVSNAVRAVHFTNPPASCPQPVFESSVVGRSRNEYAAWLGALAWAMLARLRRRLAR